MLKVRTRTSSANAEKAAQRRAARRENRIPRSRCRAPERKLAKLFEISASHPKPDAVEVGPRGIGEENHAHLVVRIAVVGGDESLPDSVVPDAPVPGEIGSSPAVAVGGRVSTGQLGRFPHASFAVGGEDA